MDIKTILFPTDFSEHSLAALDCVVDMANKYGARVHCLHVADDSCHYWLAGDDALAPVVISEVELGENAQVLMSRFVEEKLGVLGDNLKAAVVVGRPFVEIIRYARENNVDLIVMSSHGHGALAAMLLGSVTEKVVRKAPCAVLTVRDKEMQFESP
ncbi:MAG: universal stress protein [Sedimentisphaerales bacterium]|nr:universal stress protein [Sedimentisphaerales bacterium]MBN2842751.1 universal stress protein [Sedimentisphaerales bacterium]